ncbi:MAG: glycoside hydrolase family 15 protein [Acidobacteria bacterium]|nr:glycoside hydrolase family 15 protein [Acidobacteriota bacterium]
MSSQEIENHGVIGNMRSIALVSIEGSIDFFCYPEFDSPTVFASLIDGEEGGSFRIDAELPDLRTKQLYLPDTNILLTRFLSNGGVAELTDFMPVSHESDSHSGVHQIIRMVRVIRGEISFRLRCAPRFDYARADHEAVQEGDGVCFRPHTADIPSMALHATIPLEVEGRDAVASFTLAAGDTAMFAFGQMKRGEKSPSNVLRPAFIERHFRQTSDYWRNWIGKSNYKGRWREMVNRSALVLKLHCSQQHGSVIAAATFGLPEKVGGERNWDYRYTWLRDSSFTLYAFMRLGIVDEARRFTMWLRDRLRDDAEHGPLQVMYHADGRQEIDEEIIDTLSGYRNSRPVRIGNAAYQQLQLDIYGEMMDAVYLAAKYGDGISYEGWQNVQSMLAWLGSNWERPDEGIWEVRGGRRDFLHSRLMCWVAFDRAIRLGQKRSLAAPYREWYAIRDKIYHDIHTNFWSEKRQSFVQYKGSENLDASVLLMPLMRFISPVDPRMLGTLKAVEQNLTEDSLVYRYDTLNDPIDGLNGTEGSFNACSFWYVECLARAHQTEKARLLFEKMMGYSNHLGLYAEQLGESGEHLGNFPQALTHLALISTATYLDRVLSGRNLTEWR